MYPELRHFQKMKLDYDERIAAAEKRWSYLHRQKEISSAEYEELLNQYGRRNSKVTMEQLTEVKQVYLRDLEKEREALETLDDLRESKRDRLQDYLQILYQARDREMNVSHQQLSKKIQEMERLKAEYFLMIQQIHQIYSYSEEVEKSTYEELSEFGKGYLPRDQKETFYPGLIQLEITYKQIKQVFEEGELPTELRKYVNDPFSLKGLSEMKKRP